MMPTPRKIAYLSLQAVVDGQDSWAAVTEIISGWETDGWIVDRYFPEYPGGEGGGALSRLTEMLRVQRRLTTRLSEYDAIYIRAHNLAWPTAQRAKRAGIPVIQECNGPYDDLFIAWPQTRIARPLFEFLQRSQYRSAAAIISVAEGLSAWLAEESRNPHIVTNGNGANVDVFSPHAPRRDGLPERYGVFFGQFPAWQGIPALLDAAARDDWPSELPLVFVGDGALRPAVEDAVARMPQRVSYLGRLPYAEVAGVAAHAAVSFVPMVAPERENKFSPLKLYESMACGVPVIASDVVGINEVVSHTRCGLLVAAGDAADIAEATRAVLADPVAAAAMGEAGRAAAVERYSWLARSRQRAEVVEAAILRARVSSDSAHGDGRIRGGS